MQTVTYVDQPVLKRLNDKALKYDFNRALKKAFVKKLPKTVKFPLVFTLPTYGDSHMRCHFVGYLEDKERLELGLEYNRLELWLDMNWEDYENLPKSVV